jgi:hypothetical protein
MGNLIMWYLAELFSGRENFQIKILGTVEKFFVQKIFPKIVPFWYDEEKYGTARHATKDSIVQRMRFECWRIKATHTLRIPNTFLRQKWLRKNASELIYVYIFCLVLSLPFLVVFVYCIIHFMILEIY